MKKLEAESKSIVPLQLDITSAASVAAAAKKISDRLGSGKEPSDAWGLDGLVNNAAILVTPGPVELTPVEAFRKMYEVNVIGTVAVTQSVLPLIRQKRGRIVNVASIAGRVCIPFQPAYCASKHAVEGLSDCLRNDMAPWGVTVHLIEPGIFPNTGLYDTFRKDVERMWTGLPKYLKDDYGKDFVDNYLDQTDGALKDLGTKDSSFVPKAMVHALTSDRPRYRYRVGWDSKYLFTILAQLPESILDALYAIQVPGQPKFVLPIKAPSNGRTLAAKRYNYGTGRWWILCAVLFFLWKRGNIWIRARRC